MRQLNKIFAKLVKWLLLALLLYGFNINTTQYVLEADEPNQNHIKVKSSTIISEFPKGIWLNVEASSLNKITEISSRLKIGQTRGTTYNYLCSKELNQNSQSWR